MNTIERVSLFVSSGINTSIRAIYRGRTGNPHDLMLKSRKSGLFNQGRICKYCGINFDRDIDSLRFLHGTCWQEYRKNNELCP
ncbi:MAG: hypothetical protein WBZ36_11180, partial [Candidatus Nitrosopolaris sp.]